MTMVGVSVTALSPMFESKPQRAAAAANRRHAAALQRPLLALAALAIPAAQPPIRRINSGHLKNSSVANQFLVFFPNIFPPAITILPSYIWRCSHGPGWSPAFGRAGGLWRSWTAVFMAGGDPKPCLSWPSRALKRMALCASPGKSRAILHAKRGRVTSHTRQRVSPIGRTARPGLPFYERTGNGAW